MDNSYIREQEERAERRDACKQSCTKIDQGLDRLEPRSGERAIWELFQNARDLARVDENGRKETYIKITLTQSEFIFAHKGRAFDTNSLRALVMQVSSQSKENDDTVGQYGTGFITTHVFGRKLYITGSLDMSNYYGDGTYTDIDRFVIDRTYNDIPEFVDKVADQLKAVIDLADVKSVNICREWTELAYELSSMEGAFANAAAAISSSVDVIPYVMTINKPIVDVVLENQITGDVYKFKKEQLPDEAELKVMKISIEHNESLDVCTIYYLESEDGEDIAILPLSSPTTAKSIEGIAKLFVFFPLLGTEEFGMDAIFHSKKLIPVESRDGIYLPVTNTNVRAKYQRNVDVLHSLTEMVHNYYRTHSESISGWVNIVGLTFDCEHHKEDITKEFFCNIKKKWSDFFQSQPIVNLNGNRVSIGSGDIQFFSPSLVEDIDGDDEGATSKFAAIYNASKLFYKLVERDEILAWSKVVASWDTQRHYMIEISDIAKKIGKSETVPIDILLDFDTYLSEKKLISLFDDYALIPNRNGEKRRMSDLRDARTIPVWLGEISKDLAVEKVQLFANDSFVQLVNLTSFTRNDLCEAITSGLRLLRQEYLDKGEVYNDIVKESLLKLSSIFRTDNSLSVRRNVIGIIANHIGKVSEIRTLPCLDSSERDISELPFKHLVECMLLEISQNDSVWTNENMDYVVALHSGLSTWSEYYNHSTKEGLCTKYGAFPNRNGEPCGVRDLEKGVDIPSELSSLYQDVIGADINERLVDEKFEKFYGFSSLSTKDVAGEIESNLEGNEFSHHQAVLDIINNLEKDGWSQWFPRIAANKAELFLAQVQEDCKDSIFKLMKVNDSDKLNRLAELVDKVDFDEIINKGYAAIIEKKNREADLNFKLGLGKYVERLIQEKLSRTLSDTGITIEAEQYGCDLSVCKDGKPIYYIEIKSRWGSDQSVMMSPLQMQMSVKNTGNYALCCVDMSHFKMSDDKEHSYPDAVENVIPFIKILPDIGSINGEICKIVGGLEDRLVYIEGDYKCVVPISTIQSRGMDFTSLIEAILKKYR